VGALDRHDPECKPSAWILRIANNTVIDYVRRKRPDSTRSPLTMTPGQIDRQAMRMPTPSVTPMTSTDRREFAAALKRALRRLRPKYRRCFVLRHVEQRSYAEIARIMNLPVSTVGTNLQRARPSSAPQPDDVRRYSTALHHAGRCRTRTTSSGH